MTNTLKIAALALAAGFIALPFNASAQTAPKSADPALVDAYVKATFGKAPPEWQERIVPDETLKTCNAFHNNVPSKEADAIVKRELAKVVYPADGKFLGDWKEGRKVANNGRGGQFSDPPGTVAGGNCYACHQLDPQQIAYGTIGPSLYRYGKLRGNSEPVLKLAWGMLNDMKGYILCSAMPRFGGKDILTEQQLKDVMALLFDPDSPVNQ